ncbi:hypothetical protein P691DRAFT_171941 [Macrolepiota fuliginosa MF-IS2]|uniref:Uncharacterized protein n=1 Tax=Macrolepiota fuliginosa MF-IS2 TaxID=1400762 RepID=A0A9P5X8K7_9AGAR|nr:hypothetical protein P691DRAFT_171941 [Macrolepiota fuliginosa MF-IS2]
MADSNHTPSPSSTPISNPHGLQQQSQGRAEGTGPTDSSSSRVDGSNLANPSLGLHSYGTTPPSEASQQLQRFTSTRSRGKSISVSAISTNTNAFPGLLSVTDPSCLGIAAEASNALGVHLAVHRSETHTPAPPSQSPALPCSPISPHRAKPRRAIPDDLASESSLSSSTDSVLDHDAKPTPQGGCDAHAYADRGIYRHPLHEDDAEPGTEGCSTSVDSMKTESDNGVAETESAVGSTMTEAGSSAPSDSISECSNSDVEIYLEAHGLDDSAMRMNCVGHNSLTEPDSLRSVGPESPVLPATLHTPIEGNNTPGNPPSQLAVTAAAESGVQSKDGRDDGGGWVTNPHSAKVPPDQDSQSSAKSMNRGDEVPPTAQHGKSIRLLAEGQESGSHGTCAEFGFRGRVNI